MTPMQAVILLVIAVMAAFLLIELRRDRATGIRRPSHRDLWRVSTRQVRPRSEARVDNWVRGKEAKNRIAIEDSKEQMAEREQARRNGLPDWARGKGEQRIKSQLSLRRESRNRS